MKYIKYIIGSIFIFFAVLPSTCAQQKKDVKNVIILVDISKSIPPTIENHPAYALNMVRGLLEGQPVTDKRFVVTPNPIKLPKPWIDNGGKLLIIPFGNINTDQRLSTSIKSIPYTDAGTHFKAFDIWPVLPNQYTDQYSNIDLAKARAANLAKRDGFCDYWLLVVSDQQADEQNESDYTPDQKSIYDWYKNELNHPNKEKLVTSIEYKPNGGRFKIKVFKVNLNCESTPFKPDTTTPCKRKIIVKKTGSSDDPIKSETAPTIRWNVDTEGNCPSDSLIFKITVQGAQGTEVPSKKYPPVVDQTSWKFPDELGNGDFIVTISGENIEQAQKIYIKVGSSGGWLWLLWVAVVGGLAFAVWKWKAQLISVLPWGENKRKTIGNGNPEPETKAGDDDLFTDN